MSNISLKFSATAAQEIINLLDEQATELQETVDSTRRDVDGLITQWDTRSDSRAAQVDFDARLAQRTTEVVETLQAGARAMEKIASLAHDAEVRATAIMD
ncbi:hypothetical protein [Buchananella hordeovulneris]|uniref:WXG100 family type VII secretion target n=1 Tax=Buchananella hordeovulneris TaxID=52770 RepID=A0A1Q5PUA2_9ACTO|nr:hypothetical protein [Buchananella hordeovulneris]OKL51059.1 hypothetical protein BSZ40_09130 [Buchananella hordeovulneris]RRD43280.1 hypothetical protein EII13_07220 [Buchananella hordeovulneris]RRD52067.1 hypothetical protein EII12_06180 [Buchananella hordeovulneris]